MHTVIIVDDDKWALRDIQYSFRFRERGFEVIGAYENAESALEAIRLRPPDLIVSDVCMASASGLDLARSCRDMGLKSIVVIVSGYDRFSYVREALQSGVFDYLLKPVDGRAVAVPSHDMILGSYYLTMVKDGEPGEGKVFRDVDEATMAYDEGDITLHAKIKIRMTKEVNGEMVTKLVPTTLGRVIFNNPIPQDLGFVDRTDPEKEFDMEIDFPVIKKNLGKIVANCINVHGLSKTAEVLDYIKSTGYKYSTKAI